MKRISISPVFLLELVGSIQSNPNYIVVYYRARRDIDNALANITPILKRYFKNVESN